MPPSLSPYFARRAIDRLDLKAAARHRVEQILDLLDEGGVATVGAVLRALYLLSDDPRELASANTQLNRLVRTINEVAGLAGSSVRIEIDDNKQLGTQRNVRFVGAADIPASSHLPDLNATPNLISAIRGLPATEAVVILTFNEHEQKAISQIFAADVRLHPVDDIDYLLLGQVNGFQIVLRRCFDQAQLTAQHATTDAIRHWRPQLILAVGIAAGLKDEDGQRLGDVLVPKVVRDTELVRQNRDGTITDRNREYRTYPVLFERVEALDSRRKGRDDWPKLHFGPLLCGNSLVDHLQTREGLKKGQPLAQGYEMESVGVAAAAERERVDWLVVKAISDWGDGSKGKDKERRQVEAATNAACVARTIIESVLTPRPPDPSNGRPENIKQPVFRSVDLSLIEDARLIRDTRGLLASLDKEAAATGEPGLPVIDYLLDWLDDLEAPPLFALLGEYGMGKTITCQRLNRELAERRRNDHASRHSIYLDLRHVTGLGGRVPTLTEIVGECLARGLDGADAASCTLEQVYRWMEAGAAVIVDGLDEVLVKLSAGDGQVFTNTLLKLIDDYRTRPGAKLPPRLLISCRTQYFRTLQDQRNHFTGQERGDKRATAWRAMVLLPLTEEQVQTYLSHALTGTDLERVMDLIRSVHNLADLSSRPVTLNLVREFLPEIEQDRLAGRPVSSVTLYRKMVQRWLDRDGGKHHLRPADKLSLAAHLAAFLWREGSGALDATSIEDWFHIWLQQKPALAARYAQIGPDQLEEDLRTATFLRREDGQVSLFRFAHTSLQEFFLADYLLMGLRACRPEEWEMPCPSSETLDFLGAMLAEAEDQARLMATLSGWRKPYRPQVSELLLAYAERANAKGWSLPTLHGIDLRGAYLAEHEFSCSRGDSTLDLGPADFRGAILRRAVFTNVSLAGADFSGAHLDQAIFQSCRLTEARFDEAVLSAAVFRYCGLAKCRFLGATGYRPQFLLCESVVGSALPQTLIQPQIVMPGGSPEKPEGVVLEWESATSFALTCAFSPDGKRFLSAGIGGKLYLWDSGSGELLLAVRGHNTWVHACAFSPDGQRILSAGDQGTLRLWDAGSGEALQAMRGHEGSIQACAFSPDGRHLLSAGDDGTLRLWDAGSGEALHVMRGHEGSIQACAFSPDGRHLLSAGDDGTLCLWDSSSGKAQRVMRGHESTVQACAFSPDGKLFLSAGYDGTLRLWDTGSGEVRSIMRAQNGQKGTPAACAFSSNGEFFLSAGTDGMLRLWNASAGDAELVIVSHQDWVRACTFSPDGRRLLLAGADGTLCLSDATSGEALLVVQGFESSIQACGFLPDGQSFVSAEADGSVRRWSASSEEALLVLRNPTVWGQVFAASSDGRHLLMAGHDGLLRLWDASSGKTRQVARGDQERIHPQALAISSDSRRALLGGIDGTLCLYDTESGELLRTMSADKTSIMSCAFSPDSRYLLSAGGDCVVRMWSADSGKVLRRLRGHDDWVHACVFSSNSQRVLSAGDDGTLRLWDVNSGKALKIIRGHEGAVNACAFSPDGRRLLSAGFDGTLRLWDAGSGEALLVLCGHESSVHACVFSPDGQRILSAGAGGTLRLWDASSGSLLRVHGITQSGGYAVWEPPDRLTVARGDVWRTLVWRIPGDRTLAGRLPLEAFGPRL